jgi:hypothetical protein
LQHNHHRYTGGEAFEHRRWEIPDRTTQPRERGDDEQGPGEQSDHQHAVATEPMDDRDEDHGHGTCGPGDL